MSPGEISGGMDAVSGGSSDVGGGGAPDTSYDLETTAAYSAPSQFDYSNYSDEASGLQAGAYSPAVAAAIVDMMSTPMGANPEFGKGFHSPGLTYGTLAGLEKAGYGKTDIPGFDQNIEQALAAQNVHGVLNYALPALANLAPGYGLMSSIGRGISTAHGLLSGRLSPSEALPSLAGAIIGAKTGIPSGILEGLFEGNLGKAAGSGAQAGLGALASNFGPFGSLAYGLSGLGSAVNRGVSDAVSGATGARSSGLGSLPGAGPAPSTSTAPTGNVYGDAGVTQDISPVLAAIEQEAQQTQPAFRREMLAGRYGPIMQYEFGA